MEHQDLTAVSAEQSIILTPHSQAEHSYHFRKQQGYRPHNVRLNMATLPSRDVSGAAINNIDVEVVRPREGFYLAYGKRAFDIMFSLFLLPLVGLACLTFLVLNPISNRGPLFFVQPRMGKNCKAFAAIKFRSMRPVAHMSRNADDPLEEDRITKLGRVMRKLRIDELPQVINVLRGEMSLIGPRPDYFHHARRYLKTVSGYRQRHSVLPGISGFAQTEVGYVASIEGTKEKVKADLHYIANSSFRMDVYVFYRTLLTVFGFKGS